MSAHAAASLRAHAALTGEPWLGDAMSAGRAAQCPALPDPALLAMQNPFASPAPGAHGAQPLPEDYLSIMQAQQAQQANSDFQEYLNTLPGQGTAWGGDVGAGLSRMGSKAEGMCRAPCSAGCAAVTVLCLARACARLTGCLLWPLSHQSSSCPPKAVLMRAGITLHKVCQSSLACLQVRM